MGRHHRPRLPRWRQRSSLQSPRLLPARALRQRPQEIERDDETDCGLQTRERSRARRQTAGRRGR
eukprot:scaffold6478_cov124-Isochrysis_galbana.AAC.3